MDEERYAIIAEIKEKEKLLNHFNIKEETLNLIIADMQKRIKKIQKRKQEIHVEIDGIKQKVLAWENNNEQGV